jgi:predicted metal-binding membrane protein
LIGGCLAALVILSWIYLLQMASSMSGMPDMPDMPDMPGMPASSAQPWGATDLVLLFAMWAIMMVAMMVPSALPMAFGFLGVNQRRRKSGRAAVPTSIFVAGYIVVWSGYSAAATLAQWGLHEAALISEAMTLNSPALKGGLLMAAGAFQWTPLKRACLSGCRSPLSFLMSGWREGHWGAFVMGLKHGGYCVGCCWILMALLFVGGVMNLLWVSVIAAFVMMEKLMPQGGRLGKAAGLALAVAGIAILFS